MEKIDLVYNLRNTSRWQNNEIKYSLRSVEKNLKLKDYEIGNVFIVGYLPKFINQNNIIHIGANDPYSNKQRNAIFKLKLVCSDPRLSRKFILMNDDFFLLKTITEIPAYIKGCLAHSMKVHRTHGGYYYKAIRESRKYLESIGIEKPLDYELHTPIIFDKVKFLQVCEKVDMQGKALLFRSIYHNILKSEPVQKSDVKIFANMVDKLDKFKKLDIMSTDDKIAENPKFQKFMRRKFPNLSKYEKEAVGIYRTKTMFHYGDKTYNPGDIIRVGDIPQSIVDKNALQLEKRIF